MDVLRPLSGISFASPRSARFPDSNEEYTQKRRNKLPTSLKTWVIATTVGVMVALAIVIEVALLVSTKRGGFPMGSVHTDMIQWLSGFLPTLLIGPLVWIWKRADKDFKKLQPYVTLSQGPAKADQTVLLDLEHQNVYDLMKAALKNGHYLIIGTSVIVLINILLHPLAGSFFIVRPGIETRRADNPVRSTAKIGLDPSYKDLTSFVAAAGFADAAAFHNLSDPPFVRGSWAVAEFKFPIDVTRNATLAVHTTGIQTNVTCAASGTFSLTPPTAAAPLNWTLSATLPARGSGCTVTQSIDSSAAVSQYGVEAVPGCAQNGGTEDPFAPALFWFFHLPPSGTPVGSAVFCAPSIGAFSVDVAADVATGLVVSINATGGIDGSGNNVTGGGFAGKAFNGVSFDSGSDFNLTDPFVRARALAVQSGVPGAIFRFASDPNGGGGLDTIFGNSTGFLGLTEKIYTQYLSIVALSNYFVPTEASLDAEITQWPNRLWITALSAHILAALLVFVALSGTAIHILHRRQRKRLFLASRPGSMAHYMSLLSTAHTGPKEDASLVGPRDDEKTMRRKLEGMQFMLDERTGSLVPVFTGEARARYRESRRGSSLGYDAGAEYELEDPRKSLLGPEFKVEQYHDPYDKGGGSS